VTSSDDALWAAYQATHVRIERPGQADLVVHSCDEPGGAAWPFDASHAWIMTAYNPRSHPLSAAENHERHLAMGAQLDALRATYYLATGYEPAHAGWTEAGYVALGLAEAEAVRLAIDWEQNALFLWEPTRWTLFGVLLPGNTVRSWTYLE
jgi:hypothetical protein